MDIEIAINDRKCSQCVFSKQDITTSNGLYVCDIYYEIILNQQKAVLCPKFIEAKHTADYIKRLNEYASSLESRIAELEAKQRWIPVSERLPKDGDEVIIWAQNCWEAATFLSNGVYGLPVWETLRNFDYELDTFDLVTHWKERPEPPEECQHEPA